MKRVGEGDGIIEVKIEKKHENIAKMEASSVHQ